MKRNNINLLYDAMDNFLDFHRDVMKRNVDSKSSKEVTKYKTELRNLKKTKPFKWQVGKFTRQEKKEVDKIFDMPVDAYS